MNITKPSLVLFDRDGTLVRDVPYNGDPALVEPLPGAANALAELRKRGIRVGVVTNQSGVARGFLSRERLDAVNARIEELLGPFDTWQICPHGPHDDCTCRKPSPALVFAACAQADVPTSAAVMIGDIESDIRAGLSAGAEAIMVPTGQTAPEEVFRAPVVAPTLCDAVRLVLKAGAGR